MVMSYLRRYGWDWAPWSELRDIQNRMSRLFESGFQLAEEFPPVNIWTADDDVVVTAEIPGVEASDLDISVHGNTLTLRGSLSHEQPEEGQRYHRRERNSGSFARSWHLPFEVDREKIDAKLESGVLELTLPRSEQDKPKKIQVKTL